MSVKKPISIILSIILILCIGIMPFCSVWADDNIEATVLFTNDSRGFVDELTYISAYKENTPNSFLLNCGNFSKGSAYASLSNAKFSLNIMKSAGYDLLSLGSDDFAYGNRAVRRFADYSYCDMLSGNVKYNSAAIFNEFIIKKIGSLKIGFFSLVDKKTEDYIPTERASGYDFSSEIEFARYCVDSLKNKCDKVVCLASFTYNSDLNAEKIVSSVDGIDALICSNLGQEVNKTVSSTIIVGAKEKLGSLGRIDFLSDNTAKCTVLPDKKSESAGTEGTYKEYGESPAFNSDFEKIKESFLSTVSDTVAKNKTTLYGILEDKKISLFEETPLGDIFADAMALAADKYKSSNEKYKNHIVVSVVNGTAIKNNIDSGNISLLDVFKSENIAENVFFYEVNTDFLYKIMEQSVSKVKFNSKTNYVYNPSEEFLQISGFNVVVDPAKPAGSRIRRMYITDGDDQIDIKKGDSNKYLIAVNEYLAVGKAGYDDFIDLKPVFIGDFLTNYIRTNIASNISEEYYISSGTDSRIAYKRIRELQPNGDAWFTVNNKYETHAAADVLVDGLDNMDCSQVDEKGEVRITIKTGGHGITVNGEDMYVSSVSGIGIKKGTLVPIVDYKLYYKVLDDAYKIKEENYSKEEVDGYFAYLSRAYVQTKLTEEGEVVKATQDIYDVRDAFLENPSSFIQKEDDEEPADDDDYKYPSLDDFAYKGTFKSNVFENTPKTSYSKNTVNADNSSKQSQKGSNSSTGDKLAIALIILSCAFVTAFAAILIYVLKNKYKRG